MRLFFLHRSAKAANAFRAAATGGGHEVTEVISDDDKTPLLSARVLVVFFETQNDLADRTIDEYWRFYDGELAWKRIAEGDIVLALGAGVRQNDLPFKLRACRALKTTQADKLCALLKELTKSETAQPPAVTQMPEPVEFTHDHRVSDYKPAAICDDPFKAPQSPPPAQKTAKAPRNNEANAFFPVSTLKRALDWVWLIALIPLSVGVLYGINAFSRVVLAKFDNAFLMLLTAGICAAVLPAAFRAPFYVSQKAAKAAPWVRRAAFIVCFGLDIIFLNYRADAWFPRPFWTASIPNLSALFNVIGYAALAFLPLLIKKLVPRHVKKWFIAAPFPLYLSAHALDAVGTASGVSLVFLAAALFAFLWAGSLAHRLMLNKRIHKTIITVSGFAAALALLLTAIFITLPYFV